MTGDRSALEEHVPSPSWEVVDRYLAGEANQAEEALVREAFSSAELSLRTAEVLREFLQRPGGYPEGRDPQEVASRIEELGGLTIIDARKHRTERSNTIRALYKRY